MKETIVRHRKYPGLRYRCMLTRAADGKLVFKCGKCGRGNVLPKKLDRCRVCKATVSEVNDFDNRYPTRIVNIAEV